MRENLWNQQGVPHKGWQCVDTVDLRPDGQSAGETDYAECQMCGNEKIRYVHYMTHIDYPRQLEVGCVCAEKMSGDYVTPKEREAKLRSRAQRRAHWLRRKWKISKSGNEYLNIKGLNVGVFKDNRQRWKFRIDEKFSQRSYVTKDDAKIALFDEFF